MDVLLGGFYCLWLTVIKPLSNERAAIAQSLVAVFLGMSATSIGASNLNVTVAVAFAFLIGYASSRHILVQSNDTDFTLPTLLSGLVFAEVAWLCDTWAIVYPVLGLRIPQVAVILTIFTFVYNYARQAMVKYQDDFRFKHIMGPVVFGIVLIAILVLGFSNPQFHV